MEALQTHPAGVLALVISNLGSAPDAEHSEILFRFGYLSIHQIPLLDPALS